MRYILSSGSTVQRLAALALFGLLAYACGQEPADSSDSEAGNAAAKNKPNAAAAAENLRKVHIRTPDNKVAVTLRWNSDEVQVLFTDKNQQRFLRSRLGRTRQRRYHERGVGPVALVRTNADGSVFNILSSEEKLWWRVRLGKKMAMLDDANLQPVIQLRRPKTEIVQARLEEGRTELGRAVLRANHIRIFDAGGVLTHKVVGRAAPKSLLYSLMNVSAIEPTARYILMAELLIREK